MQQAKPADANIEEDRLTVFRSRDSVIYCFVRVRGHVFA